jgi:hypothetical protein
MIKEEIAECTLESTPKAPSPKTGSPSRSLLPILRALARSCPTALHCEAYAALKEVAAEFQLN